MHDQSVIWLFPNISFVILFFVFQKFEIKSGFPFLLTHSVLLLYIINNQITNCVIIIIIIIIMFYYYYHYYLFMYLFIILIDLHLWLSTIN